MNTFKKILCVLWLPLLILGCSNSKTVTNNVENININVIETSLLGENSYINSYNYLGEKKNVTQVHCNDVNSGFFQPVYYGNDVYINSIGGYSNRSKNVLEFNLSNNTYNIYEIQTGILSIAASEDYIFTTYSPINGSILTKYNKLKNSKEVTLELPGLVHNMNLADGSLYAFSGSDNNDGTSIISIIDPDTLKIKKTIEDKSGTSIFDSKYSNGAIYFTHLLKSDLIPSKLLSKLNVNDNTIANIELDENYPYQIKEYGDNLYISHYEPQNRIGNKLTIFNTLTNDKKVVSFNHILRQIDIKDGMLYAFDLKKIYIYDLNNFKLLKEFEVTPERKNYEAKGFFLMN